MTLADVVTWLWNNTAGNILATIMCGIAVWFWKLRPHLRAQRAHRIAAEQHRADMTDAVAALHQRLDAAGIPAVLPTAREGEPV